MGLGTVDAKQCQSACDHHKDCRGFSYYLGICYLKSSISAPNQAINRTSGVLLTYNDLLFVS